MALQVRWLVSGLFLFSFIFFAPSYGNYFVSDDYEFLGRTDLTTAPRYFTQSWGYGNEYRPLVAYSYALNAEAAGSSPFGYHLVNTALHTLAALLAGCIARRLDAPPAWPALTAAIFLLNPVAHESFLWISGRPVVLSTCFLLMALLGFLNSANSRAGAGVMYLAFAAGLLTYEGVIILPLLAGAVPAFFPQYRSRRTLFHWAALCALAAVYAALWGWFFAFRITRFPVETSVLGAVASMGTAVSHAFHGAHRPEIAAVYIGLLAWLIGRGEARRVAFCAVWFAAAYLPFLLVAGFAARFAYLASAAAAFILSAALRQVWLRSRRAGLVFAAALLVFYSVGMRHRMAMWKTAGDIARAVAQDVKAARPAIPPGSTLVLLRVPDTYRHALVFLTGLERAMRLQYPSAEALSVKRSLEPGASRPVVFEYREGRMCEVFPAPPGQSPDDPQRAVYSETGRTIWKLPFARKTALRRHPQHRPPRRERDWSRWMLSAASPSP